MIDHRKEWIKLENPRNLILMRKYVKNLKFGNGKEKEKSKK